MNPFRRRNEHGFGIPELMGVVVFGIGLGVALTVATVQAVMTQSNSTYTEARLPPAPAPVFVGPALNPDHGTAECQIETAKKHGANWVNAARGWRAEGPYPEPPANDESADRQARKDKWFADLTSFMNFVVRPDWVECKGDLAPPKDAEPEPPAKISGTYDVESTLADTRCIFPAPKIQVGIVEKPFTITVQFDRRAAGATGTAPITLAGELTTDLTFRVDFDKTQTSSLFGGGDGFGGLLQGSDITAEFKMSFRGRFDVFNRRTIIREGVGEWAILLDGQGGTCRFSYGATRHEGSSG